MRPFLAAAALSLLLTGAAHAQALQPGAPRADDGGVTFVKPQPKKPVGPAAAAPPVAELAARPRFSPLPETAPRTRGYQEPVATGGGGACRTSCADDYYLCLNGRDMSACGATWAQCQAACPDATASD